MDFAKTKLYQRTRSCYDKLYLEFSEKKGSVKHESSGDRVEVRVSDVESVDSEDEIVRKSRKRSSEGREKKKGKSVRRVSVKEEYESDNDGVVGVLETDDDDEFVVEEASGSKKVGKDVKRGKLVGRGKNVERVSVKEEYETDDDVEFFNEEGSGSKRVEKKVKKGKSVNRDRKASKSSYVDVEASNSSGRKRSKLDVKKRKSVTEHKNSRGKGVRQNSVDEVTMSYLGSTSDNEAEKVVVNKSMSDLKRKRGCGDKFAKDSTSTRSRNLSVDDSEDDSGVIFLGDDITCLDDYDPSHSSRVESNEVKASPVELDSIKADAVDDDDSEGLKSSEKENDDAQKFKSPHKDDSKVNDLKLSEDAAAGYEDITVISVSSSGDCEGTEEDGNAMDYADDDCSALEIGKTDLVRKDTSGKGHEEENIDYEFFSSLINQAPVDEPGKKNKKVNALDLRISKKRYGSDNENWKGIEGGLKKRRINIDSSLGHDKKVNKGGEDDFWQIVSEKSTQRDENILPSKKCGECRNKIDVIKILTDTMKAEGDGEELFKGYVSPTEDSSLEDIPVENAPVEQVVSYTFKFEDEDEEHTKPEKLESEMEVDGLFDEMNMCLQVSEIGSTGVSLANRGDAGFSVEGRDQATCCQGGNHHLTVNDEFGIICRYCSFVEIEIRDILPPLSKNGRGGHSRHDIDKKDNRKFSDLKLNNCDQEHLHGAKGSQYEKGTVWDLVPGVEESMYPHQREGFEFIWKKIAGGTYIDKLEKRLRPGGSGCIISHAPGTGKSRLTIIFLQAFMKMYPDARPLIIAPRCMLLTWEEEFKKWNIDFPFHNLNNNECSGQEHKVASRFIKSSGNGKSPLCMRLLKLYSWKNKSSVLGITYRLFETLAGEEGKRKKTVNNHEDEQIKKILLQVPTLVVLDEGHTPRNDQSLMWKALLNVKTKRSIILSGTPFQNNFDELYNTLSLVNPLLSFGMSSFRTDSFDKKRGWKHTAAKGQWDSITSSIKKSQHKLNELKAMIDPFVHVHKGTILQEKLPGLKDALVVLKPTKTQQTLLAKMAGTKIALEVDHIMSLVSVHPSLLPGSSSYSDSFFKMLKMFERDPCAGVKTNFLMELIKLSGALNEKVLVFSQYIKPLEFIMQLLNTNFRWIEGRECLYMDGQQEEKVKQAAIHTFNDPKSEAKVLLASLRACSEGINLVGASRVVLLDVHWNPSVERQAISRAYRLGQKKIVYVYHLVTGLMEGEKYVRQVEKSHLSELVFSSRNKDSSNPKLSSTFSDDKILEEMVQHEKLQSMFEKVIYQPKEADLIQTFG